jgi:hypothetical protein
MTTVQDEVRTPSGLPRNTPGRRRAVAALVGALAAAMLLTGILGIGHLHPYQVGLDFLAVVVLVGALVWRLRRGPRWFLVAVCWLGAVGVIAELGDYQARKNDTGALAATNTSYFLPALLWPYMFALLVIAIVITTVSKVHEEH